jgi:RND family efflux transporter MFP subunit
VHIQLALPTMFLALSLTMAVGCDSDSESVVAEEHQPRVRIAEVREVVPEISSRHLVLLEPWRRAQLAPRYGGQIAELLIVEESEVAAGDLLVRLVDADARGSLMSAQASRTGSEKRFDDLERQLADARDLLASGAGTRREVERLETEIETTRASIRQAAGQVIQSRDRRAANEITAPFAGVITSLDAELGEYIGPTAPMATLSELDPLRVSVPLSQFEMVVHERGALAFELLIRGSTMPADLEWISREAEPGTNTFTARLRIPNPDKHLRAGEAIEVRVRGAKGEARLVVPATAVRWEGAQAYVLRSVETAEGIEQLTRIDVTVREDVDGGVAIESTLAGGQSPLAPGDRVVSSGPATLVDGDTAIMVPYADSPSAN